MQQLSGRDSSSPVLHQQYWCAENGPQKGQHWCCRNVSEPHLVEGKTEVLGRQGWRIKAWRENMLGRDNLEDVSETQKLLELRPRSWSLVGDLNLPGIEAAQRPAAKPFRLPVLWWWLQGQSWEIPLIEAEEGTDHEYLRRRVWSNWLLIIPRHYLLLAL